MIAVECFPDEMLVRSLGIPVARVRHSRGSGNVLNDLLRGHAELGVIDEDPGKTRPADICRFVEKARQGNVILMTGGKDADGRLVMICPRLEEWLLSRAKAAGVNPGDYGLPNTTKALRRLGRYERRPKFRAFLDALLAADAEMQALKKWLAG